jgi:predicted ribosomally synthesized peptide with SipW-like signal peptide
MAIAVGAVLAGTLLTGIGTTSAAFSDTATVSAGTVGAGQVALAVTPDSSPLKLTPAASDPATVTVTGTGSGWTELWLSAVEGMYSAACTELQNATVVIGRTDRADLRVSLCELVEAPRSIAVLRGGAPSVQLTLRVTGVGSSATKGETTAWTGALRFTLEQEGGGFGDQQDVPASVTKPGNGNR